MTSPLAVAFLAERLPTSGVNATAAGVAWRLAIYAEDVRHTAWPNRATLARQCQLAPCNVSRALKALERAGLLVIERRNGATNLYRFPIPPEPGAEARPVEPDELSTARRGGAPGPRIGPGAEARPTRRGGAPGPGAEARPVSKSEVTKEVARPILETVTAGHVCDSCHEPVTGDELGRFRHRRCPTPHVERITGVVWCQEVVNR